MNKSEQATIFTTVWIVLVSLFLFGVLDTSLAKMGNETFIKNSPTEKVLKSESRNKVKYKVEDGNGNYKYSWTFNKTRDMEPIEDEVDLSIDTDVINTKINNLTDLDDKLVLTFYHHGPLPSTGEIEIDVSNNFNDGDKLYLYYFNEDENEIEYIQDGIVVNEGLADFKIEHCSEYILSKSTIEGSTNNPTNGKVYLFYIMVAMIIVFTLRAILFKGK